MPNYIGGSRLVSIEKEQALEISTSVGCIKSLRSTSTSVSQDVYT